MRNLVTTLILLMVSVVMQAQVKEDSYDFVVHKTDGSVVTIPTKDIDSMTFVKTSIPSAYSLSLKMELTKLNTYDADIKITPSNEDSTWYWSMADDSSYVRAINQYDSIQAYDQAYWEYLGSLYGKDWTYPLQYQVKKGTQTVNTSDAQTLMWNTTYYVWCYGIDIQGHYTSPLTQLTFTTPAPTPSDNVLTAEVTENIKNELKVKVTATNDDPWFISVQPKSYVEYFKDNDEVVKNLISHYGITDDTIHHGTQEVTFYPQRTDSDYYIILCGFYGGPTTAIQRIAVHTAK